jgi:hypothetical protein
MEGGPGGGELQAQSLRAVALDPEKAISTPDPISPSSDRDGLIVFVRSLCRRPHLYAAPRHVGIGFRARSALLGVFGTAGTRLCSILQTEF